jgi:hypothetical protein
MKVSDFKTIPLCAECHQDLHTMGHLTWESVNCMTQEEALLDLLMKAIFQGELVCKSNS